MALLEVKNLGISFGGLRAVDQFEINIKRPALRSHWPKRCRKDNYI